MKQIIKGYSCDRTRKSTLYLSPSGRYYVLIEALESKDFPLLEALSGNDYLLWIKELSKRPVENSLKKREMRERKK